MKSPCPPPLFQFLVAEQVVLGSFWCRFGIIFGSIWGHFSVILAPGACLGCPWASGGGLEWPEGVPGPPWAPLGVPWGGPWAPPGASWYAAWGLPGRPGAPRGRPGGSRARRKCGFGSSPGAQVRISRAACVSPKGGSCPSGVPLGPPEGAWEGPWGSPGRPLGGPGSTPGASVCTLGRSRERRFRSLGSPAPPPGGPRALPLGACRVEMNARFSCCFRVSRVFSCFWASLGVLRRVPGAPLGHPYAYRGGPVRV